MNPFNIQKKKSMKITIQLLKKSKNMQIFLAWTYKMIKIFSTQQRKALKRLCQHLENPAKIMKEKYFIIIQKRRKEEKREKKI